jgi:hypothetical protein
MKSIDREKKFVLLCAYCEMHKTKWYENRGYKCSHGICEKCCKKVFSE